MITDMNKFKQKCKDYDDFFEDIKLITSDYCSFYKKKNPLEMYSSYDDHIGLSIDEYNITIYWKEEIYSCGSSELEFFTLTIPLDFYDNLTEYELLKEKNKKELYDLNFKLKSLNSKKLSLDSSIRDLQNDIWKLEDINKKYSFSLKVDELKLKKKELDAEVSLLIEPIKDLNKQIKILEEKI